MGGRSARRIPGGTIRENPKGPAPDVFDHTGSVRIDRPPIWMRKLECPSQVMLVREVLSRRALPSLVTTGVGGLFRFSMRARWCSASTKRSIPTKLPWCLGGGSRFLKRFSFIIAYLYR